MSEGKTTEVMDKTKSEGKTTAAPEHSGSHVLVAIDKSKYCDDVLRWCASHLKGGATKITFIHAYEWNSAPVLPGPGFAATGANIVELNKHIRKHAIEEATKFMQDTAKKAKAMGFTPHELKLVNGSPTTTIKNAILDYTEKFTPDMLVCGSRGMGAMGRMFLGSVSDYLMHNCKCTVVVVKSPPAPKK
mmetsp:Transcript_21161/g.31545  ORF Transcript_21161/g.31545 Transcript_21161/m.31545 type:complete len:189 (-) Transcript_21161:161-727(-)|eukprot:CAMPEP_0167766318 /NCGR_PEP_ID=MMETSP0110_2-20121227/15269_1 /TAXON_ID=629695 /ORGANISM="Gymnochlora sp., Strain CCMP2014" /LENGTH=188 /DNA_ID=CAMNT_0007654315 /DNA_START=70 /DNA_END=636 /DNA_ORIENTATION=+